MTNEEFQKAVLQELKAINNRIDGLENEVKEGQKRIEARQDEMYQVARAIEHSNQVGRSELDSQDIRIAKLEGKIKKVAKAYNEDDQIEKASNL
jgi:hypothetical protein